MLMRSRLANRERDLLWVARTAIYGNSASPYRPLLAQAGCELGDLERLIQQEGAENALRTLYSPGSLLHGRRAQRSPPGCPRQRNVHSRPGPVSQPTDPFACPDP